MSVTKEYEKKLNEQKAHSVKTFIGCGFIVLLSGEQYIFTIRLLFAFVCFMRAFMVDDEIIPKKFMNKPDITVRITAFLAFS